MNTAFVWPTAGTRLAILLVFATVFTLLGPARVAAQAPDPVTPQISREIDRLFARWNTTDLPGCTLGVSRDGRARPAPTPTRMSWIS